MKQSVAKTKLSYGRAHKVDGDGNIILPLLSLTSDTSSSDACDSNSPVAEGDKPPDDASVDSTSEDSPDEEVVEELDEKAARFKLLYKMTVNQAVRDISFKKVEDDESELSFNGKGKAFTAANSKWN